MFLLMFFTFSSNAQTALNGKWKLLSITNSKNESVKLPNWEILLTFEGGKVSGLICNNFSGSYTVDKDKLNFTEMLSTLMLCNDLMKVESLVTGVLQGNTLFSVSENSLTLSDLSQTTTAKFEKANFAEILQGKWKLVSMRVGEKESWVEKDTLNIEKDQISGGCNNYGGSFSLTNDEIKFSNIISTKKWCRKSSLIENQYFQLLESSTLFRLYRGDLLLWDAKQKNRLTFSRDLKKK